MNSLDGSFVFKREIFLTIYFKLSFQQFTDKLENILDTLTSTEEQVTNAEPVSAHPDKIREQLADNNVSMGESFQDYS